MEGRPTPWKLTESGGHWYGRGIADNKGQHSVNMQAPANVIAARGKLGFNAKYLIEMGEETGSGGRPHRARRPAIPGRSRSARACRRRDASPRVSHVEPLKRAS